MYVGFPQECKPGLCSVLAALILGVPGWAADRAISESGGRLSRSEPGRVGGPMAGGLPLMFEAAPDGPAQAIWYRCRTPGLSVAVSAAGSRVGLSSRSHRAVADFKWLGADSGARVVAGDPLRSRVHCFVGNDPAQWRRDVPTYGRVRYAEVYPGIDLVYYGNRSELEYDWIVAPGADPGQLRCVVDGVEGVRLDASGDLVLRAWGEREAFRLRQPVAYQVRDGQRETVSVEYQMVPDGEMTFELRLGPYDAELPLVIDPILTYASFLGGARFDAIWDVALDDEGFVYVCGETASTDFPVIDAFMSENNSTNFPNNILGNIGFVAKLTPAGDELVFSTYFGGRQLDAALSMALAPSGDIYLTGLTQSLEFPVTTNAWSTHIIGRPVPATGLFQPDVFLTVLTPDGSDLVYSTYVGGGNIDEGLGVCVDGQNNAYLTGITYSTDYPLVDSPFRYAGGGDAFVTQFLAGDWRMGYSWNLGGSGADFGQVIGLAGNGEVLVGGIARSQNFPVTTNAWQQVYGGGAADGFLSQIASTGTNLTFSTLLGGGGTDEIYGMGVDAEGNIQVTGITSSKDFPVVNPLVSTNAGLNDVLLSEFSSSGSDLLFSTYLGGKADDSGWGIHVDPTGVATLIGSTLSPDFPLLNPWQSSLGGKRDGFVVQVIPRDRALSYSTYLGASENDDLYNVVVGASNVVYVVGGTVSADFPTGPQDGAVQTQYGGGTSDGLIAVLRPGNVRLEINRASTNDVAVSWPVLLAEFRLQGSEALGGTNVWSPVTNEVREVNRRNVVAFTNVTGQRFFQLTP